jgi:hypothetical protein
MRRRVPAVFNDLTDYVRESVTESLIQLTLDHAKVRGMEASDLKIMRHTHHDLTTTHRKFEDFLYQLADRTTTAPIQQLFDIAILEAYLLGSVSPNPRPTRTAKAKMARMQGGKCR